MKPLVYIFVLITLLSLYSSNAYKILVLFPIPGKSHSILGNGIVNTLVDAGHEVTVVTAFPRSNVSANIHQVDISVLLKVMEAHAVMDIAELAKNPFGTTMMAFMSAQFPKMAIETESLQNFLADETQQFDVVIAEWFYTSLLSGFAALYQCPLIWVSSMDPHWQVVKMIDERSNPAYTANIISKNIPPFTFLQRAQELWLQIYPDSLQWIVDTFITVPSYKEMYEPFFQKRGRTLPPLDEIAYNASLMFFNAQPALGTPFKLPPNGKYIGGYHIDPHTKPLPENLKKLFDNAKDGVIYFSMGSNLKSKNMPEDIKKSLVKMFGTLKQTVVWKLEEDLPDLPKNLHIIKWAPQASILNHPNTRIFITHGGKLSTTETIYYGVPIIGIPIFGDQFINMDIAVSKGYALLATFSDDLADKLHVNINKMLTDPSYGKQAKELSVVFHHLPVTPRQELVHWVEHVILSNGALHLRSPALMVPWYQKMYLDLAAVILLLLYVSCKILKLILCKKKQVVKKNKKEN